MISDIAQRIGKFIAYKKISRRTFASKLGYASSEKINRLFRKDGAKPGFDIVADIANKFVELNVDWLITGRGEMLRDYRSQEEFSPQEEEKDPPVGRDDIKEILAAIYSIASQLSEIHRNDTRVSGLEQQVSLMEERLKRNGI